MSKIAREKTKEHGRKAALAVLPKPAADKIQYDPTLRPTAYPWPLHLIVSISEEGWWYPNSEDGDTWDAHCPHCNGESIVKGGWPCHCAWCGGALAESDSHYFCNGATTVCQHCHWLVSDEVFCGNCGQRLKQTAAEMGLDKYQA